MSARSDELEGLREGEPVDGAPQAAADPDGVDRADGPDGPDGRDARNGVGLSRADSVAVAESTASAGSGAGKASEPEPPSRRRTAAAADDLDATTIVPAVVDAAEPEPPLRKRSDPAPDLDATTVVEKPARSSASAPDLDATTVVDKPVQAEPSLRQRSAPAADDLDATRVAAKPAADGAEAPEPPLRKRSASAMPDLDATISVTVPPESIPGAPLDGRVRPHPAPAPRRDSAETAPDGAADAIPHTATAQPAGPPTVAQAPAAAGTTAAHYADGPVRRHVSTSPETSPAAPPVGQDVADETARAIAEAAGPVATATDAAHHHDGGSAGSEPDDPAADALAAPPRRPDRHTPLYGHGFRVLPWKHKSRLAAPQRRRRKIVVRSIWGCVLVFFATVGWSIGKALTAPGTDTIQVRLAEWGRDHGLAGVVSTLEQWQYDLNPPKKGGSLAVGALNDLGPTSEPDQPRPSGSKPSATADSIPMRPNLAAPAGVTLAPGEGVFHVAVSTPDEQPVIQFAKIRPDATYTSVLEDVVWIDQKRTSYILHPGHEGGVNKKVPVPNQIDADARPNLIALYNGGFKINESHGGYYDHGTTVAPLVDGAASEVIFKDGHLAVGMWGRDFSFSKNTDIVSVRQNLKLMVDGGQVVPYIDDASNWGRSDHGSAAVWRSGVGVTAEGDVVYVAGNDLTAPSLANLLKLAGAQYAMQLDINLRWADFQYFPNRDGNPDTSKMYKDFLQGPTKFFYDSTKDFMAVYLRPAGS